MTREFYLLSIFLNQQARLELQTRRQRLFRELGLTSALAFEPVIPLAWCSAPPDSAPFARFAGKPTVKGTGGPIIETGKLKLTGEALFLEVTIGPPHTAGSLRAALPDSSVLAAPSECLFPVEAGIFLAAHEFSPAEQPPARQFALIPPKRVWNSSRIGAYTIRTTGDPWWQHVEWSLDWQIQLKRI
ncbi:MAG: hypothetical protein ACOC7X_09900 [Spirochaetota bacterium]